MRYVLSAAAITLIANMACAVGTLEIGDLKVEGNQVVIPIVLGGDVGHGVASMDFRMNYNPDILRPASAAAGSAAVSADKNVIANVAQPGEYAVVMVGFNQTTCSSGEVARIVMERVNSNTDVTQWDLGIARPTLASPEGPPIEVKALPFQPGKNGKDSTAQAPAVPSAAAKSPDQTSAAKATVTPANDANAASQVGTAIGPIMPPPKDAQFEEAKQKLMAALADATKARATIETPAGAEEESAAASGDTARNGAQEPPAIPGADNKEISGSTDAAGPKNRWTAPGALASAKPNANAGATKIVENTATSVSPMPGTAKSGSGRNTTLWVTAGLACIAAIAAAVLWRRRLTG